MVLVEIVGRKESRKIHDTSARHKVLEKVQ